MAETKEKAVKPAKETKEKAVKPIDSSIFVKFLDGLEEGLAHYAGRRTERLRREFVTDLTELITKTREALK
jgi:hypothetical protein